MGWGVHPWGEEAGGWEAEAGHASACQAKGTSERHSQATVHSACRASEEAGLGAVVSPTLVVSSVLSPLPCL